MRLIVSNASPLPIYEQIVQQVKQAILAGEITEGDPLPSIRQLARDLRVSVITTTRAYNDLVRDGFIVSVPGKGAFVRAVNAELIREQALVEIETTLTDVAIRARIAGLTRGDLTTMLDAAMADGPDITPPEESR
ncbi:MAG: GntR family transcriptional regulator [Propionibacteriaceae bacterium]|nr:GntR family transcriptional regulator [Propionibacteriaceae bacterium]